MFVFDHDVSSVIVMLIISALSTARTKLHRSVTVFHDAWNASED